MNFEFYDIMKLIDLFKNKRGKNMALYILIGIIFLLLVYFLVTYNSLVKSNNIVKEAFSTMDVYLKKRWDLIPNLVEIVKEYTKYEQSTLMQITNLRTDAYENMTMNKKININEQLTQEVSKIMLISENYPELKASENLNTKLQVFPSNIVARMFGFKPANMFIANAEEKNNVKVDL